MATAIKLVLMTFLVATAPGMSMKWALWKQKGFKTAVVEIYASRDECEIQAMNHMREEDGWKYSCRRR